MAKQVFLSSVFRTLGKVRQAVHDRLIALGYVVWWAEDHPQLRNLPTNLAATNNLVKAVCLQGIEASDIYLGIYTNRYGSDPLELAFTELEYHYAVSVGIPRFLYMIRNNSFVTDDQKIKQQGFLHLIKDTELSPITPSRVNSLSELLKLISIDFTLLNQNSKLLNVYPWDSPCIARIKSSSTSIIIPNTLPDLSINEATTQLRHLSKQSFPQAAIMGLIFIQRYFSSPNWVNRMFVKDLEEFLSVWSYVSTWAGIDGVFGQTNISKARMVLCQMMNDYLRVYDIAGAVASGLYADHRIQESRKWYDLSRRFELRLNKTPWLLGPLELAEGNLVNAKSSFLNILRQPSLSAENYSLRLSYYGLCLVKEGKHRNGIKHLNEAIDLKNINVTTLTRIHRIQAQAYLEIGDINFARQNCEHSILIAREHGLKGQLRKSINLWNQIETNYMRPLKKNELIRKR